MTFADARLHPRWTMYEAPGGSNLRKYSINRTRNGLEVQLPLLREEPNGILIEREFTVSLASSGQLSDLIVDDVKINRKKCKRVRYRSGYQFFEAMAEGAEVLFDRPYLEHDDHTETHLSERPGSIWFKLTLEVQSQAPSEWVYKNGTVAIPPHCLTSIRLSREQANTKINLSRAYACFP